MDIRKLVVVILLIGNCNSFALSQVPSDDELRVASMFETHINILTAIQSFDLLIDGSRMVELGGMVSHERIFRARWIRRLEDDEQLYVRFNELHPFATGEKTGSVEPSKQAAKEAIESKFSGFAILGAISRDRVLQLRNFPRRTIRTPYNKKDVEDLSIEGLIGIPELRLIGLRAFPLSMRLRSATEAMIQMSMQPAVGTSILSSNDERVALKYEHDKLDEGGEKFVRWWDYDPENLVLTAFRHYHWNKELEKLEPWYIEQYEWGRVGATLVPIKISGERLDKKATSRDPEKVKFVTRHVLYDFLLKWNVVNTDIDASAISDNILSDMNAAKAMTDPDTFKDTAEKID